MEGRVSGGGEVGMVEGGWSEVELRVGWNGGWGGWGWWRGGGAR